MLYFDRLNGREAFASRPFRSGLPLFLRLVYDFDGYARNLSVFAVSYFDVTYFVTRLFLFFCHASASSDAQ